MQKVLSSYRGISLSLAVGLAFASLVLILPLKLQAVSREAIITFSGQKIPSVFDGLRPSFFALELVHKRDKSRKMGSLWEEKMLDKQLGARLKTVCTTCDPDTPCSGHYEFIYQISGGCVTLACLPISNFITDTHNAIYSDGEYDSYCMPTCCVRSIHCLNP